MGSMPVSLDNVPEEIYCSAWAVVLARHAGVDDECEVAYGCAVGASPVLSILRLTFSADTQVGSFLRTVRQELDTLGSAETLSQKSIHGLAPFRSTLRVESSATLPEVGLDTALNISCTSGEHTVTGTAADSARADVLLAHLEQAVIQLQSLPPWTPLRDVDILSDVDIQHLLRWNKEPPPHVDETLCSLFARQAQLRPAAPAVCSWDGDLSYAQLDELSAKLAGEVVRQGVRTQDAVALCFDKSALAVVAMLAVLRAGAAFVNLGVSLPQQRQAAILDACQATLLIVDAKNASRLHDHPSVPELLIDDSFVAALPTPATLPEAAPSHAAAITFTSGSTGTPKGIVVEHGSIATSCDAMANRLDLGPHSRVLQFASYTFDASVGDIFYALARGACVCSPSEQERVDDLAAAARRMHVNWAFLTPSVLSLLEPHQVPSLRRLLLGGEKPDPKHVATWAQSLSLHLVMGPAECAIYCAASDAIQPGQDPSTFGRAEGCRLWVVDPDNHRKLAPLGCPGELVVEGSTVARGYLNDAERTRLAFLDAKDVPWLPPQHASRVYKSGDLVRFNVEDGTFSFVARKDTQVKLHGQRVELSEIEYHLKATIPGVDSALALLNTSAAHANRHPLVCFLVFANNSAAVHHADSMALTPQRVDMLRKAKDQLATILPAYMIPTLFIPLGSVPFTANGKRDTAVLRNIVCHLTRDNLQLCSLSPTGVSAARPLTNLETQLRDLWAQALHIDPSDLRADSDFIQQGGDSLAAMHLVSAAIKAGLHLQVSTILMHPRLSEMASKIRPLSSLALSQEVAPTPFSLLPSMLDLTVLQARCATACHINADQIEDIYTATPLQKVLWNASERRPGTYILQMSFQLPPSVLLQTFMSAWDQVVQTADVLRTRFVSDSHAGLLQVVSKAFIWDHFDSREEHESLNNYAVMGLGSPLVRLAIIHNSSGMTPIFVFAAHHVIYDAFMLNIIFDRVAEICQTGRNTLLSPFKNYVAYIDRLPSTPSQKYWKAALEGCPIPTWPPPSPPTTKTTAVLRTHIPLPTRPTEFTLAIIAQAAFTLLFAAHTRTSDILFGMTFSGRDADMPGILDTAGPTIYTVPVRTRIYPDQPLRTFFDGIRAYLRESAKYGHIGLPAIGQASADAKQACEIRAVFSVQPQHVVAPEQVFGPRLSFSEEMGRLPLIWECFVEREGRGIEVVAEWNTGSLGGEVRGW
ncbi:hypothetical protein N0V90_002894 [Kalmusia sp. IMI 367209]|nr:hypothetical protein N0V90_002894 [Kalmusia sp. IMI 367209]